MAEAKINPEQVQQAVNESVRRALARDPDIIRGPILIGIIAYPDDNQLNFKDIQVSGEFQTQQVKR